MATAAGQMREIALDDKWALDRSRVLINGPQAIARTLLAQKAVDSRAGLNTAGYITGYRGSPLGNVDTALWSVSDRLVAADILFKPGVNEDLAATAVRGTQQLGSVPGPRFDGVFAAWYGKGPGVDRSIDALKHGNYGGAHAKGGVLIFYGDDHGGKSSTVSHHSEQAIASAKIPSLYPASVAEILSFGLLGIAMSRYSGSWVGIKLVNEVAEQTATIDVDIELFSPVLPPPANLPPEGIHARRDSFIPLREEQIVAEHRLPLVHQFVRANRIDRVEIEATTRSLGIISAGKSYGDVRQGLGLLGLTDQRCGALGISLYKVGCIWPIEPEGIREFARGNKALFVVEEKSGFLEEQIAHLLYNDRKRPQLVGKTDEKGRALLSTSAQLEPIRVALAIVERLARLGIQDDALDAAARELQAKLGVDQLPPMLLKRAPYFCSGCPHSRSTRVPSGSLSMTGIGCHTMVALARPSEALLPTHMGGEGANWMGLAPFTNTAHMFQNMGDGTYYHSGLMAIRAAVASGVNITYKILYNDAVAMTGGQPVDGPISVAEIAQQVRHEGVRKIVVLSDNPEAHRGNRDFPTEVEIEHRDKLDKVQRELRDMPGCTVLIYEQTCAAEKRRRRKRGIYPDPQKRLFISEAVCEGCGDCSAQSTCVSLQPVATDLGMKRRIDQGSCNKDYSCLNGFCPSFITVEGADLRKPKARTFDANLFDGLPTPGVTSIENASFSLLIAGIGGTGVITVGALLGMAAHLEGRAASLFDMTGLAQKNGAVFSHVRIADKPDLLHAQRLGRGEADLVLAFDIMAALADEATATIDRASTRMLVNTDVVPTVAFQFNRDAIVDSRLMLGRLGKSIDMDQVSMIDASKAATTLLGDSIGANLFLVGVASQQGLLPVAAASIERAIELNRTAVALNLAAFRLGRLYVARPEDFEAQFPAAPAPLDQSLDAYLGRREAHLVAYQNVAYGKRYRSFVDRVRAVEQMLEPGSERLTRLVARSYAKVLAYKDEYEVARLLTDDTLKAELAKTFTAGAKFSFNIAPPILGGAKINGRPRKRAFRWGVLKPVLSVLARAKGLRGTLFDPFGYTGERKRERALIDHYESLVEEVLADLAPERLERAIALLGRIEMVRGFGPIKEEAMQAYYRTVEEERLKPVEPIRAVALAAVGGGR